MSINHTPSPIYVSQFNKILDKFPIQYRDKLRMYTLQELFYIYKIATFQLQADKNGDTKVGHVFICSIKRQLFSWLKGELTTTMRAPRPVAPGALDKIGKMFKKEWNAYVTALEMSIPQELLATKEAIETLKQHFVRAA